MAQTFEDIFARMARVAQEQHLAFLVIGGHAVNAYGYARTTLDADFLIPVESLPLWRKILESWGCQWLGQTDAFAKFKSGGPAQEAFVLDLMTVNADTFAKLQAKQQDLSFGSTRLPVPHPLHLIALKLHAMRNPQRFKKGKDLPDILHLIRICQVDTEGAEFHEILKRYASDETKDLLEHYLKGV